MTRESNLVRQIRESNQRLGSTETKLGRNQTASLGNWQTIQPSASFANYGAPYQTLQYARDNSGMVHLRGVVQCVDDADSVLMPPLTQYLSDQTIICPVTKRGGGVTQLAIIVEFGLITLPGASIGDVISVDCVYPSASLSDSSIPLGYGAYPNYGPRYNPAVDFALPAGYLHNNGMFIAQGSMAGPGSAHSRYSSLDMGYSPTRRKVHPICNAANGLCRSDIMPGAMELETGDETDGFDFTGVAWATHSYRGDAIDLALAAGITTYNIHSSTNVFGTPHAIKDNQGWVHLGGLMWVPAGLSAGDAMFTMPLGWRPAKDTFHCALHNDQQTVVGIATTGVVSSIYPADTVVQYYSLDGVHFHTT